MATLSCLGAWRGREGGREGERVCVYEADRVTDRQREKEESVCVRTANHTIVVR